MKLNGFTLQIFEINTIDFYTNQLGFQLLNKFSEGSISYYNLGFKNTNFYIKLKYDSTIEKITYKEKRTDNYWKYSLFVDDIQKVFNKLKQINHNIKEPFQFGDIGYLAHTTDTENHIVEYIQKTFKQNKVITTNEPTALGLLTIRTKDPLKSIAHFENILDLKLFVRMYVNRGNGFTIYFLGDKNLTPPSPDIDAIENREWMYQQSHLFIEIQHYWNSEYDEDFSLENTKNSGLQTINFSGDLEKLKGRLTLNNIPFNQKNNSIVFKTIDNHKVLVTSSN